MAVVLVSAPDEFALTKGGRMLYQFTGSGRYESTGARAVTSILIASTGIADGDKMVLSWGSKEIVMTARTAPSAPGEFPAGNGSAAYLESILPYFKGYYPIRQDFTLKSYPGPPFSIIELTARKPGAAYTIEPYNESLSISVSAAMPAGGDPLIRERYGVYIEVYLQKPGTQGTDEDDFELVGQGQHVEADDDGRCEFDVGDLLHGYLSADIPAFGATGGQLAQTSHRKYYIAYGEAWGNPIKPTLIKNDTIRHAYLGGADFDHRASGGFSLSSFLQGNTPADDRALRFGPSTRKIYVDEPAWLTFLNVHDDVEGVTLSVDLTFSDGSTATATGLQQVVEFKRGAKVCFPVGVTQRGLIDQVPQGKFLQEYAVTLRGAGVDLSRPYRFVVDYDPKPYRRYFAYQNSLGAFDCITTWGKGSAELQRFYEQAERALPSNYSPTAAQYVDYNVSRQQSFEVTSGWQLQEELIRWDDFYCAYVRFQVTASKAVAIGLTSKQIKQFKDGDNQFAHSFSYSLLHRDEYYSEDTQEVAQTAPVISVPVGTVTIQPTQPVLTRDPSIDDSVRTLTPVDILNFRNAAARPNPETLGFLTQQSGSTLFRRADLPVPYSALSDKPTTLEGAGLALSASHNAIQLIKNVVGIKQRLRSWTDQAPI